MELGEKVKRNLMGEFPFTHKIHKNESFLSGCVCFDSEYRAMAFLPEHHYFCDHVKPITDLMFLLECARQAETYIVHRYEHQPFDTKFILAEWSCEFLEDFIPTVNLQGKNIAFNVITDNSRRVRHKLISQEYKANAFLNDNYMAVVHMLVKYMSAEAYYKMRSKGNNQTIKIEPFVFEQAVNVLPEYVYRRCYDNVVVKFPKFESNKVTSTLTVNMNNTAYFDHAQDHYPAMVLMEAGKQNCQLFISRFSSNKTPILTAMKSRFFSYAEFNKEVQIISEKIGCNQKNKTIFNVLLKQGGVSIAEMAYSFQMVDI
ncbi:MULTISPECIES: AfsA-related hotdog domain-containing protein [Pantoea]|uniref:AfsA-related hotdog domain-containing protein n=1 Tax=Pantoea TaxID=53335 RepID=UPI002892ED81|nr:AfsA-related hotdog domain-containing protein [Pantoea sp. UBA5923]